MVIRGNPVAGGGSGTITFSSIDQTTSNPVAGGKVEVWNSGGTILLDTIQLDGSGNGSKSGLSNGTSYLCKIHPTYDRCLGNSEPDSRTIVAPGSAQFVTQVPVSPWVGKNTEVLTFATSDIAAGTAGLWQAPGRLVYQFSQGAGGSVTRVAGAGPTGGDVIRYTWADRSSGACGGDEDTVAWTPAITSFSGTNPPIITSIWASFYCKEIGYIPITQKGWHNGKVSCGGGSYKYNLIGIASLVHNSRFGSYSGPSGGNNLAAFRPYIDWNDTGPDGGHAAAAGSISIGFDTTDSWGGTWNMWAIELTGISSTNAVGNLYLNGVKILTCAPVGGILPNTTVGGAGFAYLLEMGGNINNGPDQIQSRDWARYGFFPKRPALIFT